MKCLALICLFAFATIASAKIPPTPKNSIRVTPISIFADENTDPPKCEPKCSSDCTTLTKCVGTNEIKVNCRQQTNGQKPYCNEELKQCDASSETCPSEIVEDCDLDDGFYPNIINCKSFFYCNKEKKKRINYNCMGNTVYNAVTEQCEVGAQCVNFDPKTGLCKDKYELILVHPYRKSLYVVCNNPPELYKCPNDNYEFDPSIINCNYVCKMPGMFNDALLNTNEDKKNNIYYYECAKNGAGYLKFNKKCAKETHFEELDESGKGKCVLND